MIPRPGAIAGARAFNAVFFLTVATYGFLSFIPFSYEQFIKPDVLPAMRDFVAVSPWLFWLSLLITVLTLLPQLRGARGQRLARGYVIAGVIAGIAMLLRPPLPVFGNNAWAFAAGLIALAPPVALALMDHVVWRSPAVTPADRFRALEACVLSAVSAWVIYAAPVPLRMRHVIGIDLSARALAFALSAMLIVDLFVFMALFLALLWLVNMARASTSRGSAEYALVVALLAASSGAVVYTLGCASIAFRGWPAAMASTALGLTLALVWADLARLRAAESAGPVDSLSLFAAPIAGVRSRVAPALTLAALPFIAYGLLSAVAHFDWNFLLQKMSVLMVWLFTFAAAYAAVGARRRARPTATLLLLVAAPLVALTLYTALGRVVRRTDAATVVDRYAAVDPSFRLVRDASTARSSETVEYYARLRAHTLVNPRDVDPPVVDFVRPLHAAGRSDVPDIFVFVIDSLRRDYVSPYNPAVTFTPAIEALAADSFVFDRAFTRYSGTALALPAIWEGGMVIHTLDQPAFDRRNTLLKLLDANGYVRLMGRDQFPKEIVSGDGPFDDIDRGKRTMDIDLCASMDEAAGKLTVPRPPVFFYALPQNVHLAVATRRTPPEGESYPGFFAPVASGLRRLDACLGRFVDLLKRTGRYDNSVIIVTSDHGDSLGEEGRWGHAYFLQAEVMRIPLIIHVPPRMKARASADLAAVSFSTDIAPSLYALLGYDPADLGPLYGRPLFVRPDALAASSRSRRRQPFVLASSYGAAYAVLDRNGGRMYVVDAEDGRDDAFDLTRGLLGRRMEIMQAMMDANRSAILQQLSALAAQYHYEPRP